MPDDQESQLTKAPEIINDVSTVSIEKLAALTHEEITKAAAKVIEYLKLGEAADTNELKRAWGEYADATEAFVDSIEEDVSTPKQRSQAQISAILNKAFIFNSAGNELRYLEELDAAEVYAFNEGFDQVSELIQVEINAKAEALVLKLKGIIEEDNRQYLWDLVRDGDDMDDLLGAVYEMIEETGQDANEVLARMGMIE